MSKLYLLILITFITQFLFGEAEDLFISEYLEGSAQNKAIEIFNGTGDSVDLSDYTIRQSHNGEGWGELSGDDYFLELVGVLGNGDVLVIATDQADSEILDIADLTLGYPSVVHFNGNDAVGLFKNGVLIDVIGVEDESDNWSVAGNGSATAEHTLVRKPEVESGETNWEVSAGTSLGDSQWQVHPQDSFMFLGEHTMGADSEAPEVLSIYPAWINTIELSFSEPVAHSSAENADNYEINGVTIYTASVDENQANLVILDVSDLMVGDYLITINNVADEAGNCIDDTTYSFEYFNWEIVINEIHYNPATSQGSDDDYEFIELYNRNDYEVDLTGYQFVDAIEFIFPSGVIIEGGGFAVIARNIASYQFIDALLFQWDAGEQLTNSGGTIIMQNNQSDIVDRVSYFPGNGWPGSANGSGSSLELTSAFSHNALPQNWQASQNEGGTPGYENTSTSSENEEFPNPKTILTNYPNPFNPATEISFQISDLRFESSGIREQNIQIEIYNIKGQKVKVLTVISTEVERSHAPFNEQKLGAQVNIYSTTWHGTDQSGNPVSSGIYFYKLNMENSPVGRMVLIK